MPRRPDAETLESLGKRLREKEEALKWVLKTLPRVLEQMNRLEQQLRGMQSLVLEHGAEFMAAREPECAAVIRIPVPPRPDATGPGLSEG